MPGAERTSQAAGEPSGRAKRTSRADERSQADVRAGQLGARRTGDEERHWIRFYFFFFEIVSMVSEPNKMTAAHSIAVEANHKTLK